MSLLWKRVEHKFPDHRQHLREVILVLSSVPGITDMERFELCCEYVRVEFDQGKEILKTQGRQAFELFMQGFLARVSPTLPQVAKPKKFFGVQWLLRIRTFVSLRLPRV